MLKDQSHSSKQPRGELAPRSFIADHNLGDFFYKQEIKNAFRESMDIPEIFSTLVARQRSIQGTRAFRSHKHSFTAYRSA